MTTNVAMLSTRRGRLLLCAVVAGTVGGAGLAFYQASASLSLLLWAVVGGSVVVAGLLGTAAWRHPQRQMAHPFDATSHPLGTMTPTTRTPPSAIVGATDHVLGSELTLEPSDAPGLPQPAHTAGLPAAIGRVTGSAPPLAAAAGASQSGAWSRQEDSYRARILLVEDNVVNQRVACGLLVRRGHDVTVAKDGREALARLERDTFDLVLMDLQMPVMGGLEATMAMRTRERATGKHVRIVAMTAHAMSSDREFCLAAGMDGYLSKPIDPLLLFAAVEQDGAGAAISASPAVTTRLTFDLDALRRRMAGDEAFVAELLQVFLAELPSCLEAIRSALTDRDIDALRTAAQALKGAAGNVSADRLFDAAYNLEFLSPDSPANAGELAWQELSTESGRVVIAIGPAAASVA